MMFRCGKALSSDAATRKAGGWTLFGKLSAVSSADLMRAFIPLALGHATVQQRLLPQEEATCRRVTKVRCSRPR